MHTIQEMFDAAINEQFSAECMGTLVIERRFEQLGIKLTEEQMQLVRKGITEKGENFTSLIIDDSQVPPELLAKHKNGAVTIGLGDIGKILADLTEEYSAKLHEVIPPIASEIGEGIAESLHKDTGRMLRKRRKSVVRYESFIKKKWKPAFDILEAMIVISEEAGEEFHDNTYGPQNINTHLHEASIRLHTRGCQVASEILTLLKAGYAAGAHARWRCLHEIVVTLYFLAEAGESTAERYLLHEPIESFKMVTSYQEHCKILGYEPLSEAELLQHKAKRDALIKIYGKPFGEDYGWAAEAIGKARPTLRDLEMKVELVHMRPFFKLASRNIHASSSGLYSRLGTRSEEELLAGPSVVGLSEAGQSAAISISQATTVLLVIDPNMDRLVLCNVLQRFMEEAKDAFFTAEICVEEEVADSE